MSCLRAKVRGQRAVGSEVRVKLNGRRDEGDCITCRISVVGKHAAMNIEEGNERKLVRLSSMARATSLSTVMWQERRVAGPASHTAR